MAPRRADSRADHLNATFFRTPADFRRWLKKHHQSERELWVGYYKKGSGRPSITWPESVDEALCFGWIDGVRKSIDDESYAVRFTPRTERSIWSAVNTRRAEELIAAGRMEPAGLRAFESRQVDRSGAYSFEQRRNLALDEAHEAQFKANKAAWTFFQAQPPGYRRTATWYVLSAKREETRQKRLRTLIEDSAAGRRIGLLQRDAK